MVIRGGFSHGGSMKSMKELTRAGAAHRALVRTALSSLISYAEGCSDGDSEQDVVQEQSERTCKTHSENRCFQMLLHVASVIASFFGDRTNRRLPLPIKRRGRVVLGDDFPGVVGQRFGLRQQFQTLDHFWVGLGSNLHAFILAESIDENL